MLLAGAAIGSAEHGEGRPAWWMVQVLHMIMDFSRLWPYQKLGRAVATVREVSGRLRLDVVVPDRAVQADSGRAIFFACCPRWSSMAVAFWCHLVKQCHQAVLLLSHRIAAL